MVCCNLKLTGTYLTNINQWIIQVDILTLEYFIIAFQMQTCLVCQPITCDRSADRHREVMWAETSQLVYRCANECTARCSRFPEAITSRSQKCQGCLTRDTFTTTWWSRYRELLRGHILTNATTLNWIIINQNHVEEVNGFFPRSGHAT